MNFYAQTLKGLIAGTISGILILGLAGRAVTAGIALVTDTPSNLSFGGIGESVVVGALVGANGGCLLIMLKNMFRVRLSCLGIAIGIILFIPTHIFAFFNNRIIF